MYAHTHLVDGTISRKLESAVIPEENILWYPKHSLFIVV